jgi:hypothetical protein
MPLRFLIWAGHVAITAPLGTALGDGDGVGEALAVADSVGGAEALALAARVGGALASGDATRLPHEVATTAIKQRSAVADTRSITDITPLLVVGFWRQRVIGSPSRPLIGASPGQWARTSGT